MQSMDIEMPESARELQAKPVQEVRLATPAFRIGAAVVAACICLQTIFMMISMGFQKSTAGSLGDMNEMLPGLKAPEWPKGFSPGDGQGAEGMKHHMTDGDGDDHDPFDDHGDDHDTPVVPIDNSSKVDCDAGFYKKGLRNTTVDQLQKLFKVVKADFASMWLDPDSDSRAWLEFAVDDIEKQPLEVGIGAIFERGANAHLDISKEGLVYRVGRSSDKKAIIFERLDMSVRLGDDNYQEIFNEWKIADRSTRLPAVAQRYGKVDGECRVTHMLVDASELVSSGFDALEYPVGGSPHIVSSTAAGHPFNIDFTVKFGSGGYYANSAAAGGLDDLLSGMQQDDYVRFCFHALPADKMPVRPADERAGFFLSKFTLFGDFRGTTFGDGRPSSQKVNPTVRIINRQRLKPMPGVDKDGKKLSEANCVNCQKGIHYFVDYSIPKQFREATKAGVLAWRKAFKPIHDDPQNRVGEWEGTGSEVVYAHSPDDPEWPADYDVGDIRFNTISWMHGDGDTMALGMSVVDTRTSEVLKANIVFTLGWLQAWLGEAITRQSSGGNAAVPWTVRQLREAGPATDRAPPAMAVRQDKETLAPLDCSKDSEMFRRRHPLESQICRAQHDHGAGLLAVLAAVEGTPEELKKYLDEGVASVTVHEVGHTLGLRHNFRGSTAISLEQLKDPAYIEANGLGASVMDYCTSNLYPFSERAETATLKNTEWWRGVFGVTVGDYDKFAIKYGYTPVAGESATNYRFDDTVLPAIATEYDTASFTFATDEDADGIDPLTRRFDLASDPVQWNIDQMELADRLMAKLGTASVKRGESWNELEMSLKRVLFMRYRGAMGLVPFVGGLSTSRKHANKDLGFKTATKEDSVVKADGAAFGKAMRGLLSNFIVPMEEKTSPYFKALPFAVSHPSSLSVQPFDVGRYLQVMKMNVLSGIFSPPRAMLVWEFQDLQSQWAPSENVAEYLPLVSAELFGLNANGEDAPVKAKLETFGSLDVAIRLDYVKLLMELVKGMDSRTTVEARGEASRLEEVLKKVVVTNRHGKALAQESVRILQWGMK